MQRWRIDVVNTKISVDSEKEQRERSILKLFVGAILGYYVEQNVISIEIFNALNHFLFIFWNFTKQIIRLIK